MIFSIELFTTGVIQGLVLSMVAMGIMIPFRILNFPDLTSEASYPLGGALSAYLLLLGISPLLTIPIAMCCGGLVGIGTAFLHLRFKMNSLLAGILLSTMIYSINLRLMGKPNVALFDQTLIFAENASYLLKGGVLFLTHLFIFFTFYHYFISEKGLRFRAVGANPVFSEKMGICLSSTVFLGLFLSNALHSLAGSLMIHLQHYADIGMGTGIVIHGLAALMIGESILGTQTMRRCLMAPLVGALLYQQIQGLALCLGLAPSDLKLVTGLMILLAIGYKHIAYQERAL